MAAVSQAPVLDLKILSGGSTILSDVDAHMQRFLKTVRPGPPTAAPENRAASDPDLAEELIGRASKALDVLVSRCHQLEADAATVAERTKLKEQEQAEAVIQWQKLASGMKSHAQKADKDLTEARQRVQAAESRAAAAEVHAAELQKALGSAVERAAAAERLSTKLQQLVNRAFGVGSSVDGILEHIEVQHEGEAATQAA